jgi:hypothetical protein
LTSSLGIQKSSFPATEFRTATDQPALGNRLLRSEVQTASEPIAGSIRALRTISAATRKRPFWPGLSPAHSCFFVSGDGWRSFEPIFGFPSLHPKIPFPAAGFRMVHGRSAAQELGLWTQNYRPATSYYCGFSPSASNCRLQTRILKQ